MSFRFALPLLLTIGVAVGGCSSGRRGPGGGGDGGPSGDAGSGDGATAIMPVTTVVIAPGTPADAPNQFGGPQSAAIAPTVAYPADGVIMPPNILVLEFQWTPAAGTSLFQLHFTSTNLDLTVYTICNVVGTGCGYSPDDTTWMTISNQVRGDTMKVTISAALNGQVGSAPARSLSFTNEDLLGGLYYWAASQGTIVRYDFGKRNQSAESFYSATDAGAICVGCHALSRKGDRVVVGLNIPEPAGMRVLDVATKTKLFDATVGSDFETFSPDGSRLLASSGNDLVLYDGMTGTQVGSTPVITNGMIPDWSADGTQVVFARPGTACPLPGVCPGVDGATLYTVPVTGDTFGTPKSLVTGGGNDFYPSFSPDGSVIAFNRSASSANSFDALDAKVWAIASTGGNPVALTNASSDAGDSWPKFAPFSHHFRSDTIFWLTFSSRRDYGLRIVNSSLQVTMNSDGTTDDPRTAQVWMVGVPASAIMNGTMPTGGYAAFWLPFQSMKSGNHIAQWVEGIAYQPCGGVDAVPCPIGDTCESGNCVGVPIQ